MISVVIPLYNKERSILSTLQSVCSQTYSDFEAIVVDDGSTDSSGMIADTFPDDRVRVIHKSNSGVCSARNRGIEEAKSDFIALLDADDYWEPSYLRTLVQLIRDYPQAGLWGLNYGTMIGCEKRPHIPSLYPGFRGIIENPWIKGNPFCSSAICFSKRAFETVGGFDERIALGEDLDLWYRLMLEFPCAFEDNVLSYYRVDAENRASNHSFTLKKNLPYYIFKYADYRAANKDFRKYFDQECLYRLFPYAVRGEDKEELKQSLSYIDWSLQKKSMRLRFRFPHLYYLFQKIRDCIRHSY